MTILENFDHFEKKQNKEHFMDLVQVALADGKVDQTELDLLQRLGRKMGFTDQEITDLIESTTKAIYMPPNELSKRFEQVYEIVKMILADGEIDKNEMRLANSFATKSGFSDDEITMLLVVLISGIRQGKDEEELFEDYMKGRRK